MPSLPSLNSPCDVLDKLKRERLRVLIGGDDDFATLDHFYNFCVTAWSLSDYAKQHPAAAGQEQMLYARWLGHPMIAAARDIANRSKHFTLRKTASTRAVSIPRRGVVDILEDPEGNLHVVKRDHAPIIEITMDDGTCFDMWQFLHGVIEAWAHELQQLGISCP